MVVKQPIPNVIRRRSTHIHMSFAAEHFNKSNIHSQAHIHVASYDVVMLYVQFAWARCHLFWSAHMLSVTPLLTILQHACYIPRRSRCQHSRRWGFAQPSGLHVRVGRVDEATEAAEAIALCQNWLIGWRLRNGACNVLCVLLGFAPLCNSICSNVCFRESVGAVEGNWRRRRGGHRQLR